MLPAKWSTLNAKPEEHFSAYNLLDAVDHFLLLLRTLHLDSKEHLLLVLLLFFWLLFLSSMGSSSFPATQMSTLFSLLTLSLGDLIHHTHVF